MSHLMPSLGIKVKKLNAEDRHYFHDFNYNTSDGTDRGLISPELQKVYQSRLIIILTK
jgi:hypothetical protein